MAAESMEFKIGLNVSTAMTAVRGLIQATGELKSSLLGIGGTGGAAFKALGDVLFKLPSQIQSISGALNGLMMPPRLAGSLETTSVAFRVLIGDSLKAQGVLEQIRELAAATPFEFPELAAAARALAAFGEAAEDIPGVLRRIGDIASGTETPIADLAAIYGKARVQGTLFAEDINQLTGRGIPIIQEFAKQMGVTEGQVKKLAEQGKITFPMLEAAFKDLTGEGGKFSGMMAEISQTFEGKMSTLSDSLKGLLAAMGAGINEGLKPVMDELTKQLDSQQGLAKSIGESIGYGIEVGLEVLQSGELGEVLSTQLIAAGTELAALLAKGAEKAGEILADRIRAVWGNDTVEKTVFKKDGQDAPVEGGSDYLNQAARDARAEADAALSGPKSRVDQYRGQRKNAEGLKKFNEQEALGAKNQAAKDAADAKEKSASDAKIEADVRAQVVDAVGGEDEYILATQDAPMWYDDEGNKAWEERKARVAAKNKAAADVPASPAAPAGPASPAAPAGPASPAAPAGPATAASGLGAGGQTSLASAAGEGAAVQAEERRKITGARYAKGAASGLGDGNAYRRDFAAHAERRGTSDRMKSAGNMSAPDPREQTAMKALALLEKHLPEMARNLKQAVEE